MTLAWVDASAGVAGDMLLGALLDAGAPLADVRRSVAAVVGDAVSVDVAPAVRAGLRAGRALVEPAAASGGSPPRRTWRDVRALLADADLPPRVRDDATAVFARLAAAEGRVHGVDPEDVHFHEVGALDAIADVVGTCAALAALDVERLVASPVAVGSGSVRTGHGVMAVPVPAVVELLVGAPTEAGGEGELATPTGAALLATLAAGWGPQPPMRVAAYGVGAGSRDPADRANVVRVLVGEPPDAGGPDPSPALVLEANVDDLDPRLWPGVLAALLDAGASDAWLTPILMKKGRPAHTLSVLTDLDRAAVVRDAVFRQSSSIGLREVPVAKHSLARSEVEVDVDGQVVRVKLAHLAGEVVNVQPEWEDVAAAARALGSPAKQVLARAVAAASHPVDDPVRKESPARRG